MDWTATPITAMAWTDDSWFHVTRPDRLSQIAQQGLLPRQQSGVAEWTHTPQLPGVYLWPTQERAQMYLEDALHGEGVMLRVHIPNSRAGLEQSHWLPDHEDVGMSVDNLIGQRNYPHPEDGPMHPLDQRLLQNADALNMKYDENLGTGESNPMEDYIELVNRMTPEDQRAWAEDGGHDMLAIVYKQPIAPAQVEVLQGDQWVPLAQTTQQVTAMAQRGNGAGTWMRTFGGLRTAMPAGLQIYVVDETTHDEQLDPNERRLTFVGVIHGVQVAHLEVVEEAPDNWVVDNIKTEGEWTRQGIATALLSEARAQLGEVRMADPEAQTDEGKAWATKVGSGTQWVYVNGHVAFGTDYHHGIARQAAEMAGLDENQTKYVSNMLARAQMPEGIDVAVGQMNGAYPQILMSTVDRNAVWDAVTQAVQLRPA
mgnify:CR=1 FL=1